MILTASQSSALSRVQRWALSDSTIFVLAGYAGTGKTTILQEFINNQSRPILACAPTGKAASVLARRLTNARVTTIHSAIYNPVSASLNALDQLLGALVNDPTNDALRIAVDEERARLADASVGFRLKEECKIQPGQIVIIDEASMVTRGMQRDLARTNAKILYVGDPGQLPPVADDGFFRSHTPDVMLTEVMRQALDSPIIRLSMEIRNGNLFHDKIHVVGMGAEFGGGVAKIPKKELAFHKWLDYDQVLTGKNDSRQKINRYFRAQKYPDSPEHPRSWWPYPGDKLLCLKNEIEGGVPFINGVAGTAISKAVFNSDLGGLIGDILYDGMIVNNAPLERYYFQAHYDPHALKPIYDEMVGFRQFDYAYAITVHKSQGSEWDRVILADDGMQAGNREFRKLWLYTAVTRAKKELVWLY